MRILLTTIFLCAITASPAAGASASSKWGDWQSGGLLFLVLVLGLLLVFVAILVAKKDPLGGEPKEPPAEVKRPRLRGMDYSVRLASRAGQRQSQGQVSKRSPAQPGKPRR